MVIHTNYIFIFGREIPLYGVLFIAGFALAILSALPKAKKYGIKKSEVGYSAIFAAVGGVVGAKLLAVITEIPFIIEYCRANGRFPLDEIMQGGFVFYGGLIGGALGLFLYCKGFKLPFAKYADLYAAGTALGHAVGRVGCIFSGCCYGMEVSENFPFYFIYESTIEGGAPVGVRLLPVQLIEICYLVVIFAVCETVFRCTKRAGNSAIVYAASYAAARFVLEFFRGDAVRGLAGGVSTSQYISFAILMLCWLIVLLRVLRKYGVLPRAKTESKTRQ